MGRKGIIMRAICAAILALVAFGLAMGVAEYAKAEGGDGCVTYFGQVPGGMGWICYNSQCNVPGGKCVPQPGPVDTQCGCNNQAPGSPDCILLADWDPELGWVLICAQWSCANDCPLNPGVEGLPGSLRWSCACP